MAIPKTFSAPPDVTFPTLGGFAPTVEDCVRAAVWLMLYSDDVNRNAYSYEDNNPAAGVRIRQGRADHDPATGAIILPQQLVLVAVASGTWRYSTSKAGTKRVTIGVMHMEAIDTSYVEVDVDAPSLTPEARLGRVEEILMRGTLYDEAEDSRDAKLIDPYYSPRNEDGTYDMSGAVFLSTKAPDIRPSARRVFPNRHVRTENELLALDPRSDFAVTFGLFATYDIDIANRENMRRGGYTP